jgi:hypothetical protein
LVKAMQLPEKAPSVSDFLLADRESNANKLHCEAPFLNQKDMQMGTIILSASASDSLPPTKNSSRKEHQPRQLNKRYRSGQ